MIVTHDPDFGMHAVVAGEPVIGIVYLRPGHIRSERTIETVSTLLAQEIEVSPPFIVVVQRTASGTRIRVRQL